MIHTHQTAPTQFVKTAGVRFAYRRFEAVPREFAVKAESRSEMTPEAFLRKSLRRLYQPLGGAQPERLSVSRCSSSINN